MHHTLFTIDPDKEFEPTLSAFDKMPKARRMVKAIQNELKAKRQSILEWYDLLKGNGRLVEENANTLVYYWEYRLNEINPAENVIFETLS